MDEKLKPHKFKGMASSGVIFCEYCGKIAYKEGESTKIRSGCKYAPDPLEDALKLLTNQVAL